MPVILSLQSSESLYTQTQSNKPCALPPAHTQGYGYLEDRRPSANVDPYNVARLLIKSTLNN